MDSNLNNTNTTSSESYWMANTTPPSFPELNENVDTDVGIVGGGITGITTAYLLAKKGYKVAIIEADQIITGTTGHTTAKITAQHDLIYDEFINHLGEEEAKQYYQANQEALDFIKQKVKQSKIECEFKEEDAYLYATTNKKAQAIEKEAQAYDTLGIDGQYVDKLPIDFSIQAGIVMKNQAQFHPIKYLTHLVKELQNMGAQIFENTTAVDVIEGNDPKIVTKYGFQVTCKYIVSSSHFPFYDGKGLYFSRMYAERSYIVGGELKGEFAGGMYLSADKPKRSIRTANMNGKELLLIGGESHKTGQGGSSLQHFQNLKDFGKENFGIDSYLYNWGAQDLITLDKVPYIGQLTSRHSNIFVATGYRKWGMTNSTTAALLISDLIQEKDNPYQDLFSPTRFYADPSIKTFLSQNANVAAEFVKGKLSSGAKRAEDLRKDEGDTVTYQNNQKAGGYRDTNGQLHIVDRTCTHLGCEVEWNDGEKTWDCPCHGSRFSYGGEVYEGPADKPLKKLN